VQLLIDQCGASIVLAFFAPAQPPRFLQGTPVLAMEIEEGEVSSLVSASRR